MKTRDFAYWLQGYFEIAGPGPLSENQVKIIMKHLNMVFYHEIDPSFGANNEGLDEIHGEDPGQEEGPPNNSWIMDEPSLAPSCPGIVGPHTLLIKC